MLFLSVTAPSRRSSEKGQKLKEARELQVFEQAVEDIEDWISDMEKQLASQDLGRDLISVNNLLKSHNVSKKKQESSLLTYVLVCVVNLTVFMHRSKEIIPSMMPIFFFTYYRHLKVTSKLTKTGSMMLWLR